MDPLMRLWLAFCLGFAMATATSITPTDLASPFDQEGSDALTLSISKGEQMIEIGPVAGLTMTAKQAVPVCIVARSLLTKLISGSAYWPYGSCLPRHQLESRRYRFERDRNHKLRSVFWLYAGR